VEQTILYDVSHPINGDNADVWGLELGVQHFFENGFGVRASYSYTDTTAYIDGQDVGPLEGVSESAWSAALIYEDDRWSTQVAADYSGEYTEFTDAVGGRSQIADPITWVTASVAYRLNDTITLSLEGRNLLDEYYWATLGRADIPAGFETWGRTYVFSVIARL
jgi:outer membrane receptor protein involved in Fe transport